MITPHIAATIEQTRALPYAMSLRLLDSKDGPIASQLSPFAQSYDVSQILNFNHVGGSQILTMD